MAGSNTPEATDRCEVLKEEVKDLEEYEKLIDQHKNVSISHFIPRASQGPTTDMA